MADPMHPTNGEWELYDPELHPAPRGVSLLLINPGGVLQIGQWYDGALAWGKKPRIPVTVKARLTKQQKELSEIQHETVPESGSLDP